MGGGRRGDKLKCQPSRSKLQGSAGDMDDLETTCELLAASFEATLAVILTSTNKRIDDFNATLITNKECHLLKLKADMKVEMAKLRTRVADLKYCMSFTSKEVKDLRMQLTARPADTSVVAERLDQIDREIMEHTQQIDYLENQSWHCNVCIDGIPEEVGET